MSNTTKVSFSNLSSVVFRDHADASTASPKRFLSLPISCLCNRIQDLPILIDIQVASLITSDLTTMTPSTVECISYRATMIVPSRTRMYRHQNSTSSPRISSRPSPASKNQLVTMHQVSYRSRHQPLERHPLYRQCPASIKARLMVQ
ncbi:hypothetical protein SCHPADRAFT_319837 [Schizopora paradoxa]|uniref:Uncharacterized protein n=1 Tax=Schizopora paradoxa TaxID=27342 RepID=A0A0H2RXV5_9AGAM|nr:hypothetical protein SCHPADRAFT_319837 [Schizopora paradoxa]